MNRNTSRSSRFDRPYRDENYGYGNSPYNMGSTGRGNQPSGYGSDYYNRGSERRNFEGMGRNDYRERDEPGWFERAGDRVREGWNNLRERFDDDDDNRGYRTHSRYQGQDDDRNFFERAGDKISETWNDLRGRDDDRDYDRDYRSGHGYGGYNESYGRGMSGYTQSRGYDRDRDINEGRSQYGRNYPSRGRYGNY